MKKFIVLAAFALFTITAGAQEAKPTTKKECSKKEACCTKTMSKEEIEKCQAKCKAEGKTCTVTDKKKSKKDDKKCCAKKA